MSPKLPIFVTGNKLKVEMFKRFCPLPIEHHDLDLIEIQSLDPEEIVRYKLIEAYRQLQRPVLLEDVSLTIEGMNGLPGPLIKYFLQRLGSLAICRMLDTLGVANRNAVAQVVYGYYDGEQTHFFTNAVEGSIADTPRGDSHGFNPIFIPKGEQSTWAEMSQEDRDRTSMRRPALESVTTFLSSS